MGLFDWVNINGRMEQTKALGKSLRTFKAGDEVHIYPAPMSLEQLEAFDAGTVPPDPVTSFQVALTEGWALVQDNILVDWQDEPVDFLPVYDYFGYLVRPALYQVDVRKERPWV